MTHVTCRLTAKNRDELRNPTLGSRVWATFTFTEDRGRIAQQPSVCFPVLWMRLIARVVRELTVAVLLVMFSLDFNFVTDLIPPFSQWWFVWALVLFGAKQSKEKLMAVVATAHFGIRYPGGRAVSSERDTESV